MSVRLITTDEELVIVFRVLMAEYRERINTGTAVIFLPWKFILPEEKIEIKDREKTANFSFKGERANINAREALRMLGVTLYHLAAGKSELTHESFLLDGYRRPLESNLWPVIRLLLRKEEQDIDKIEEMIDAIDPKEIKAEIEPTHVATPAGIGRPGSVDNILKRLAGERIKVIDHAGVANFWGITVPQDIRIRYGVETLREVIAANKKGERWTLAYYSGLSLKQMRDKIGADRNRQPCFYNNDWWLQNSEDEWVTRSLEAGIKSGFFIGLFEAALSHSWATSNLEPGYYLLNFNGKFANKRWLDQENMVAALGPMYERAHETIVSETAISNFGIHNGERLMENWYHWGKETAWGGDHVDVGDFDPGGFGVDRRSAGDSDGDLRVVVFRKFDF